MSLGDYQIMSSNNNDPAKEKVTLGQTDEGSREDQVTDKVEELACALADFKAFGSNQLSFDKGTEVRVLLKQDGNWWWAEINGCQGYVPANHLSMLSARPIYWQDEEYFGNYSHLKLHHEMLSDRPRTEAYLKAVQRNSKFLSDKTVLDVGCGTGILSMFCAKYGNCKKVYAVEASDFARHTELLVERNHLGDKIQVINEYVEELPLVDKVDVIISEWMGTFLLFEMMLEAVIIARDKFLSPSGLVWPSSAQLFLVPCSAQKHYQESVEFWGNLYGLDFSCLREVAVDEYFSRPVFDYILETKDCLAKATTIRTIDMKTITVEELEKSVQKFRIQIEKSGILHGFCSWFEVAFPGLSDEVGTVTLNTGPMHELTHWRQNLFMLDRPIKVKTDDVISGTVRIERNPQLRRHIRLHLSFSVTDVNGQSTTDKVVEKLFKIWR